MTLLCVHICVCAGNFWLYTILGYTVRLGGSKFFGAELQQLFWWMVDLCAKGALLLVRCISDTISVMLLALRRC